MKKAIITLFYTIGLLLFSISFCYGQKKVLGKPVNYNTPIDYFDNEQGYDDYLSNTSPKSKDNAWAVIADRDDIPVYSKPDGIVLPDKKIKFKEFFYVVEEKGEWIKIVKARVDELKIQKGSKIDYGWVRKKSMLMWNEGVSHPVSLIHRKVLLLNRKDQIEEILKRPDKEIVKIYADPAKSKVLTTRRIFEFFFLLKKENGMYLLSNEAVLNLFSADQQIVGWVNARDCDIWDTRICLEPNFQSAAVRERKSNSDLIIRAYDNRKNANMGVSGTSKEFGVFWKNDPVNLKSDETAKTNPNRLPGSVLRFPMVSISGETGKEVYRSGIVGKVKLTSGGGQLIREKDEVTMAKLDVRLKALQSKSTNVNIFYVIEGTDYTKPFKESILQSINSISTDLAKENLQQVKYGALIYRDIPEEEVVINGKKVNRLTEFTPLHTDIDKLTNFIRQSEFTNKRDRDEYTALFYGINRALLKAGFKSSRSTEDKPELNIIILVGAYGDFRVDRDRRSAAKGHPAYFDAAKLENLVTNLYNIDAHLYTVQLHNDGYRAASAYVKGGQYLMVENAKRLFNEQQKSIRAMGSEFRTELRKKGYFASINGPTLELDDTKEVSYIEEGAIPGQISRPISNQLSHNAITNYLRDNIQHSVSHVNALKAAFVEIVSLGSSGERDDLKIDELEENPRTAGEFEQAFINELILALNQNPDLEIPDITDEKYKLFTEVYIPYKYPEALNPLVSYVLFMPESDLVRYLNNIERNFSTSIAESSYDKKREGLVSIYKALIDQFTGEGAKLPKKEDDLTIADVQRLINGVYTSGLKLEAGKDIPIKDLTSERKVSNKRIDELIQRFAAVQDNLKKILREGEDHDFCYKTLNDGGVNRYYWVPIEDTF